MIYPPDGATSLRPIRQMDTLPEEFLRRNSSALRQLGNDITLNYYLGTSNDLTFVYRSRFAEIIKLSMCDGLAL